VTYMCSCIFPRISIILGYHRFTTPSCRLFFWNHTLLGYQWHTKSFKSHAYCQSIDYFRKDYYPNPFYLSCHMRMEYLYMFWLTTPSLILPLQWCFLETSKSLSSFPFYHHPCCIHICLRIFTIGSCPSVIVPIFSTLGIHHHIHILH
jgi:hypothetical protein